MRLAGVIGWPVAHSRSPALHNAAYRALGLDARYDLMPVAPDGLAAALAEVRARGMMGVNVTVPHKQEALRLCDDVDPVAERVGAVNTIVVRDGRLLGANTDVHGFAAALAEVGFARGKGVVLGAGGAARAVIETLGEPIVIARRGALPWTVEILETALEGATLLVDATSAGLSAERETWPAPIPLRRLAPGALVVSLVYHRETALLTEARQLGFRIMDGAAMLVHQAAKAFELMTGKAAPIEIMRAAMATFPRT